RPALLLRGNLRPRVTTTPLPHATEAHGQLLGRDFNPLDLLLLLRTVRSRVENIADELGIIYLAALLCAHHLFRIRNSAPGPRHMRYQLPPTTIRVILLKNKEKEFLILDLTPFLRFYEIIYLSHTDDAGRYRHVC
ncbi:MAG: hypothetical protein Q8M57_10330, partial [Nitrosomonas sp.]|uniref:hypothetical protein n=1 Tax=Nitrosomonas sp. TaxID=42353 RepID=UPI0027355E4A